MLAQCLFNNHRCSLCAASLLQRRLQGRQPLCKYGIAEQALQVARQLIGAGKARDATAQSVPGNARGNARLIECDGNGQNWRSAGNGIDHGIQSAVRDYRLRLLQYAALIGKIGHESGTAVF